jgi:hypothetical protein
MNRNIEETFREYQKIWKNREEELTQTLLLSQQQIESNNRTSQLFKKHSTTSPQKTKQPSWPSINSPP